MALDENRGVGHEWRPAIVILIAIADRCPGRVDVIVNYLATAVMNDTSTNRPDEVLFLCTGNAARSVMAGVALEQRRPDLRVETAGTLTVHGMPISWRTRTALAEVGLPWPSHRSRQAARAHFETADLVVGLAPEHVAWVRREHPEVAERTGTLVRLSRELAPPPEPLASRVAVWSTALVDVSVLARTRPSPDSRDGSNLAEYPLRTGNEPEGRQVMLWTILVVVLILALIGIALGAAGAWALTRWIAGLLYGVSPTDGPTFVMVSLIVMVVAFLACYMPARRATRVDPLVALRYE